MEIIRILYNIQILHLYLVMHVTDNYVFGKQEDKVDVHGFMQMEIIFVVLVLDYQLHVMVILEVH